MRFSKTLELVFASQGLGSLYAGRRLIEDVTREAKWRWSNSRKLDLEV